MVDHTQRPQLIQRSQAHIGTPPNAWHAEHLRSLSSYLSQTWGHGQVYTFTGPGYHPGTYHANPDYDYYQDYGEYVEFPVILHSSPKNDSSNPDRQLTGVLLPWRMVPWHYQDLYTYPHAKISWRHLSDSVTCNRLLYRGGTITPANYSDMGTPPKIITPYPIALHNYVSPNLFTDYDCRYTGVPASFWAAGNDATLSKDTTNYHSGTQSLKVARNGTNDPYAECPYIGLGGATKEMVTNADYYLSIMVRSDGNATPLIKCGDTTLSTGTTSTSWQHLTADFTAETDTLKLVAQTSTGTEYCNFDSIYLQEKGKFKYTPDASGGFTVGFLRVERICVAALSVFTAPDAVLTDEQAVVRPQDVAEGRAIRGYTGTGTGSIGDLEYLAGKGAAYDVDDVERNTRRCLFQSGHPLGISSHVSADYVNIRGGEDSYFRVRPRNLTGGTADVKSIPCAYGYCYGAAEGNEAYIKYTALTSGDSWTCTIDSDTEALWTDSNRLDLDPDGDYVKIEYKAPPNGYIVLRGYSLWEDAYDQ